MDRAQLVVGSWSGHQHWFSNDLSGLRDSRPTVDLLLAGIPETMTCRCIDRLNVDALERRPRNLLKTHWRVRPKRVFGAR